MDSKRSLGERHNYSILDVDSNSEPDKQANLAQKHRIDASEIVKDHYVSQFKSLAEDIKRQ